jgi:hypothetical protein
MWGKTPFPHIHPDDGDSTGPPDVGFYLNFDVTKCPRGCIYLPRKLQVFPEFSVLLSLGLDQLELN